MPEELLPRVSRRQQGLSALHKCIVVEPYILRSRLVTVVRQLAVSPGQRWKITSAQNIITKYQSKLKEAETANAPACCIVKDSRDSLEWGYIRFTRAFRARKTCNLIS